MAVEDDIAFTRSLRRLVFDLHVDAATATGLELGPSANPLVKPDEGPVKFADYLTRQQHIDMNHIAAHLTPETDFILTNNDYVSQIPGQFDYVVANHVIEHAPNMIGFLRSIGQLCKPGGVIFLAIPDKKFTFDKYRQNTDFAHVVHDFYADPQVADQIHRVELAVFYDQQFVGKRHDAAELLTQDRLEKAFHGKAHIGMHCHVFQSETILETLIKPLCATAYVPMQLLDFRDAKSEWGGEMILMLRNTPSGDTVNTENFYSAERVTA